MKIVFISFALLAMVGPAWTQQKAKPEMLLPMGHLQPVNMLDISPDSRYVATASNDNTVILWDAATGAELRTLALSRPVKGVRFLQDGVRLVTASGTPLTRGDGGISFKEWDWRAGRVIRTLPFKGAADMRLSENGRYAFVRGLYTSDDQVDASGMFLLDSARRPDAMASFGPGVWDLQKDKKVGGLNNLSVGQTFLQVKDSVYLLSFRTDRKGDKYVKEIDFQNLSAEGAPLVRSIPSDITLGKLVVCPGRPLMASFQTERIADKNEKTLIRIWDAQKGLPLIDFPVAEEDILGGEFSQDGKRLLTWSRHEPGETIRVWSTADGTCLSTTLLSHQIGEDHIRFSPDGNFFVVTWHQYKDPSTIILYSAGGKWLRRLEPHALPVRHYYFSGDGRYVYTDHGLEPIPDEVSKENIDLMKAAMEKHLLDYGSKEAQSAIGKIDEKMKQRRQITRIWDLYLGTCPATLPKGVTWRTDSLSGDNDYMLTSVYRATGKQDANGQFSNVMNKVIDSLTRSIYAKLKSKETFGSQLKDPNSELNRVPSSITQLINRRNSRPDTLSLISFDSSDWIIVNSQGYYMCSRNSAKQIRYLYGEEVYTFDQFDLPYNRPDKVLESIGVASQEIVQSYKKAYEKRVRKMGFDPERLDMGDRLHAPEIKLTGQRRIYDSSTVRSYTIPIEASDSLYSLSRINVTVNGVPIRDPHWVGLQSVGHFLKTVISVELGSGKNDIAISVMNDHGITSLTERFEVDYTGPSAKPNLYLISLGVGKYKNNGMDLAYAAKDAADISELFGKESKDYGSIHNFLLRDEEVSLPALRKLKDSLLHTRVDDQVILFYSGHGVVDTSLDYYLGTYGLDFQSPEKGGLRYEDLQDLLDSIPAREKLLLVDACHSGELDKEELAISPGDTKTGKVQFAKGGGRSLKMRGDGLPWNMSPQYSFDLMKQLFVDLRQGCGATILSSAAGVEYAREGKAWKNGVFTYCLLQGLREGKADLNRDGKIMLSELQQYVQDRVPSLTEGKQRPTSRAENLVNDFQVWGIDTRR